MPNLGTYSVPRMPGMSHRAAEQTAIRIVNDYFPELLKTPGVFPVDDFFEFYIPSRFHLTTGVSELPVGLEGVTYSNRTILLAPDVYDQMKDGEGRARFTTIHESVHGIVHVGSVSTELRCTVSGDSSGPALYRSGQLPAYADPEWQANRVAGAILMPPEAVRIAVMEFGAHAINLSRIFRVSKRAAEVRISQLQQLGLL